TATASPPVKLAALTPTRPPLSRRASLPRKRGREARAAGGWGLGSLPGGDGVGEGEGALRFVDMERLDQAPFETGGALAGGVCCRVGSGVSAVARYLLHGRRKDRSGGGDLLRAELGPAVR